MNNCEGQRRRMGKGFFGLVDVILDEPTLLTEGLVHLQETVTGMIISGESRATKSFKLRP